MDMHAQGAQHILNPTPARTMAELRGTIARWEETFLRYTQRQDPPFVMNDELQRTVLLGMVPDKNRNHVKLMMEGHRTLEPLEATKARLRGYILERQRVGQT